MTWFIVVGRRWGDDEATAMKINSVDQIGAENYFRNEMTPHPEDTERDGDWAENDGPGTVWIDNVFDCGEHEPKEVK